MAGTAGAGDINGPPYTSHQKQIMNTNYCQHALHVLRSHVNEI